MSYLDDLYNKLEILQEQDDAILAKAMKEKDIFAFNGKLGDNAQKRKVEINKLKRKIKGVEEGWVYRNC